MQTVKIDLAERSYLVTIGSGLLSDVISVFEMPGGSTVLIVTNETVAPLYLYKLAESLTGVNVHRLILPDGESFKTSEFWSQMIDKLIAIGGTRDTTIITLGGGVVGDLGG